MIHELLHVLGCAPTCGKNKTGDGHVNDDRFDLTYHGHGELAAAHLNENHDDYFDHGIAGCPDLAPTAPSSSPSPPTPNPRRGGRAPELPETHPPKRVQLVA